MGEPTESKISAWMPDRNQVRLAVLGKLIEELNECSARAARCIIHGVDEIDPDTGRRNAEELSREISDVLACLDVLDRTLGVDWIEDRRKRKVDGFYRWHDIIRAAGRAP